MRWEGHDIIKKRVKKYSINCDLKWGYLDVALKNRHIKDFYQGFYQGIPNHMELIGNRI